jgi:hypothetical protein
MQSSAFRGESLSFGELTVCTISRIQLVNGLFYPFKRFAIPPNGQWCETYLPASFTHQGYLATLLLLLFPWARRRVPREHRRYFDGAFATGVLFLLAALGALTWITAEIPIVNRLRWPFKYFGFGNFPLMLSTAPAFDAIVQWRKSATGRSRLGIALIALQVFNLAALDLSFPRQAFVEHLDPLPLEEPLRPMLANTRMVSVGCVRAEKLRTVASLGYDYATLWELHHFGGYDPLVPYQNYQLTLGLDYQAALCKEPALVPVEYLRQWGVRYYILKEPPANWYAPTLLKWGMRRVHSDRDRIVLQDPAAAPLAGGSGCALQRLGRRGDDLTAVMACSADSLVTLRFLFDPRFTVTVDGVLSKAVETETNQLSVAVPRGVHEVRVAFDDPRLDEGLWIALFALVIVTGFALLRAVRRRSASAPPHKAVPHEPGS